MKIFRSNMFGPIRYFCVIGIIVLGLLTIVGTGGDDDQHQIGWAVGLPSDGYGTIIYTSDSGQTWTRQGDTLSIPNVDLNSVRAIDSLTAWVVGGSSDGYGTILKTTDGGNTWVRLGEAGEIPDAGIGGISVLDENNAWIVSSDNTILFTNDGGNTWISKADPAYNSIDLSGVFAVDANNIWICGGINDGFILHSTDGGNSWISEGDTTLLEGHTLISISAANQNNAWAVGHGSVALCTSDAGVTWENKSPTPGQMVDVNGVCVLNENIIWIVMDYGNIYLTEDGGQSWTKQESNSGGYYMLRICAIDKNTAWIAGFSQFPPLKGIILHTTDGGQTWNEQNYGLDNGLWDVSFVNSYH